MTERHTANSPTERIEATKDTKDPEREQPTKPMYRVDEESSRNEVPADDTGSSDKEKPKVVDRNNARLREERRQRLQKQMNWGVPGGVLVLVLVALVFSGALGAHWIISSFTLALTVLAIFVVRHVVEKRRGAEPDKSELWVPVVFGLSLLVLFFSGIGTYLFAFLAGNGLLETEGLAGTATDAPVWLLRILAVVLTVVALVWYRASVAKKNEVRGDTEQRRMELGLIGLIVVIGLALCVTAPFLMSLIGVLGGIAAVLALTFGVSVLLLMLTIYRRGRTKTNLWLAFGAAFVLLFPLGLSSIENIGW